MKGLEFPIIGTKIKELKTSFDLETTEGRKQYFETKASSEIKRIRGFLEESTFIAYFLGKKSSGKGTYSKLISEVLGEDRIAHISVGDLVRETDNWEEFVKTERFKRLKDYYRGYLSFEDIVKSLANRSTEKLLPTEFILALVKARIDELQGKAIFIDGLPRSMDQVSYSLYFRDVANYRDDPDFFVLLDVPESVIEERMKYRVICPLCQTSRNTKLLITSKIGFDEEGKEFYLVCDNPKCKGEKMVRKEGDEKGLSPIRERLNQDEELLKTALRIYGIPKILLRNHVPVKEAAGYYDDYEITPEYLFRRNSKGGIVVDKKPWIVQDDNGVECYSLLAPPVVISFFKQLTEILGI